MNVHVSHNLSGALLRRTECRQTECESGTLIQVFEGGMAATPTHAIDTRHCALTFLHNERTNRT
jgi:hypothetical protein